MSTENRSRLKALDAVADAVSANYDADIYLYSGPINSQGYADLIGAVLEDAHRANGLLILTTHGGDLSAAYQIARFLHRRYARLFVCVPGFCKSAGTLIALGAHKLLIDDYSELGPLDALADEPRKIGVQTFRGAASFRYVVENVPDLFERILLAMRQTANGSIPAAFAAGLSLHATCTIMHPLLAQISVAAAAEESNQMAVALAYGRRLAEQARNTRGDTVERLIAQYPSHDFVIDHTEARSLFASVEAPSESLYRLLEALGDPVYTAPEAVIVKRVRGRRPATGGPAEGRHPPKPGIDGVALEREQEYAASDRERASQKKSRRKTSERRIRR